MRLSLTAALLLFFASAAPVAAQVGHPPRESPYREIRNGHSLTPVVGYFAGGGGEFGIGAHNGVTYGIRYDLRAGKTVQFGFSAARGALDRFIVDPFVSLAERRTGPFDQTTTFTDVTIQLNLSGGKTWNRLAPYAGVTLGVAFGEELAADTSGYEFGNKFYLGPQIGTRLFLTDNLHLRAEVRGIFWKVSYPNSFGNEPVEEPGTPDAPNAVIPDGRFDEWTLNPWFQAGIGYMIRF
ncbi:MAG TPA: hypothetical protein VK012_05735 [Gemmatimonadales bacterium]|nr:hypothetical protein [Gemmatimonadales bacterium]